MANQKKTRVKTPEPVKATKAWQANRRVMTFVAGIFFLSILSILFRNVYISLASPNISTEIIRMGNIESPKTITGVIIREEQVYYAERDGELIFNVNDYERVKPNMLVVSIQNMEEVKHINQSMATVEEQIMELQNIRQDISAVDPVVQRINGQLKNIIDGRVHHFTSLNLNELYSLKDSLNQIIDTRNQMILEENKNVRTALGQEQENLRNRLSMHTTSMFSEQSGIMSRIIDGLEEVLTTETMKELTREETLFSVDYDKLIPAREVSQGDPVFKLVTNNTWYIAAYFPNELVEGYGDNQQRTLFIELNGEFVPISVRIERMDENFNDSFLLLRCTKNIIDFLNTRRVNLRTTENIRNGLKISNSAVVTRDFFAIPHSYVNEADRGGMYVLKEMGETTLMVPVESVEPDELYAYVPLETENLRLGDVVINAEHPGDTFVLQDLHTVQGVYKANSGYADFTKITTDEYSGSGSFILLDPLLNPRLRIYDQIITNARDVRDGQIIY
jgi:hypothetical protein